MKRIYTRTGDCGMTRIFGGERVAKDDVRIEANGCLDELNTVVGIVRSLLSADHPWQNLLHDVQINLMVTMSHVATPSAIRSQNPNQLDDGIIECCECEMDRMTERMDDNHHFILPGGTPIAAQLHFARVVCRRAERRLWTLHREDTLPEQTLRYINRLSDLFFVMARFELHQQEWSEERWQAFNYKRKL